MFRIVKQSLNLLWQPNRIKVLCYNICVVIQEINELEVKTEFSLEQTREISAIEKKKMNKKDFIRTENYNLRLRPSGAKKLMEEIGIWFNRKAKYKGQMYKWGNILIEQTRELAHYVLGKKGKLDLTQPFFEIERDDTEEIREIIENMPYAKWKELGYSKGTLHPLKQKVKKGKAFTLNQHVKERLKKFS